MKSDTIASMAAMILGAGILILAAGLFFLLTPDSDKILCDGQQMRPGDRCISTESYRSGTYDELVARRRDGEATDARWSPRIVAVGGVLTAVGAVGWIARFVILTGERPARPEPRDSDWWAGKGDIS
ncbi:hypothetical protein ABZV91_09460 [Nocardia sp. NPDC004568]|uniref:hypothetical protein n=1 Tax=Nocardia sp. NPDC004568 TaxID=3154551 RepID=UPI0033A5E459